MLRPPECRQPQEPLSSKVLRTPHSPRLGDSVVSLRNIRPRSAFTPQLLLQMAVRLQVVFGLLVLEFKHYQRPRLAKVTLRGQVLG